jgi:hypothetical protein
MKRGVQRTLRPRITACDFERRPTAADPCLTASSEYSTWCRRPCGEKTVLSESYVFRNYCMLGFIICGMQNEAHHGGGGDVRTRAALGRAFLCDALTRLTQRSCTLALMISANR